MQVLRLKETCRPAEAPEMLKPGQRQLPATLKRLAKGAQLFRLEQEYLARARAGLTRAKSGAARVHRGRLLNLWLAV